MKRHGTLLLALVLSLFATPLGAQDGPSKGPADPRGPGRPEERLDLDRLPDPTRITISDADERGWVTVKGGKDAVPAGALVYLQSIDFEQKGYVSLP